MHALLLSPHGTQRYPRPYGSVAPDTVSSSTSVAPATRIVIARSGRLSPTPSTLTSSPPCDATPPHPAATHRLALVHGHGRARGVLPGRVEHHQPVSPRGGADGGAGARGHSHGLKWEKGEQSSQGISRELRKVLGLSRGTNVLIRSREEREAQGEV